MTIYRVIVYDENGIGRAYGDADNVTEAYNQAGLAAKEYAEARPDVRFVRTSLFELTN